MDAKKLRAKKARETAAQKKSDRKALIEKSVKESTLKTYEAHIRTLCKLLAAIRGEDDSDSVDVLTMTHDEGLELLVEMEQQGVGNSAGLFAALKKRALSEDVKLPWVYDGDIAAGIKACARSAKMKRLPTGTLTEEQYDELITFLDEEEDNAELRYAVTVAYRARLRIGELGAILENGDLKHSDEECGGGGESFSFLGLHQHKTGVGSENPTPKLVPNSLREVFKVCRRRFAAQGKLFGPRVDLRMRAAIPQWAIALKWSKKLRWTGPHIFRHGGTLALQGLKSAIGDAVLSIFAQQSSGTQKKYAESAEKRASKAAQE